MKTKQIIREFFITTALPVIISIFYSSITDDVMNAVARNIITVVLIFVEAVLLYFHYSKSIKDKHSVLSSKVNSTAYTNAYQLSERKRDYITQKTYKKSYQLEEKDIPYDIFSYISEICKNFRDTISQITSIKQEYMSVTFIYHYDYKGATEEDLSWRWVVGKESSTRTPLDYFVDREGSLYNYLIKSNEGKVNSVFSNDKKQLAYEGRYYMSARDDDHNKIGSVFAVKVPFGNNAENFVEGVLLVSSYGKTFVNNSSEYTEDELKNLIFEDLYPYYQRLLETELGMLYLRHKKEARTQNEEL